MTTSNQTSNQTQILAILALIAEQTKEQISPTRLEFIYEALKPFPSAAVVDALKRVAMSARRFPTPTEILAEMGVKQLSNREQAVESVALIMGAVKRFGYTGTTEEVEPYVGPLAWRAIKTLGGWRAFCDPITNDNETSVKAQVRDLCEAMLTSDATLAASSRRFLMGPTKPTLRLIDGGSD